MKFLSSTLLLWLVGTAVHAAEPALPGADELFPDKPKPEAAEPGDATHGEDAPAVAPEDTAPARRSQPLTVSLPVVPAGDDGKVTFYQIPIREQIGKPILYIVRNGVKEAIAAGADCVVLDMNTPGGELGVTLEIMQILAKFEGMTATFVDSDAVSAGAFIAAATDRIYFSPSGVIGAAAPVSGSGQDIDETMKQKVVSYLRARIRSISEEHPMRAEVLSAMIDEKFELELDGVVIKPKGELLSLTAHEAMAGYGTPPQPLLGAGIHGDLKDLYQVMAGGEDYAVKEFQMTWSLDLAVWLMRLSPLFLGIGGVLLMIEIYSPGFGWVGITGIALILIVFFGHNVAGLSGHEGMLFFLLGIALLLIEILLFPGTLVFGILGALIVLGSLLWGMADIWPKNVEGISPKIFVEPAETLALGLLVAVVLFVVLVRFLPQTSAWNRLVLSAEIHGTSGKAVAEGSPVLVGRTGTVVSPLRPTGVIELDGERHEARSELGEIAAGTQVRVVGRTTFVLLVEPAQS